ncbi:unnamed protein product [Coregonus sp. 'balchen']|nr:unnamed protein product [Coregonus sp. 'balchen']
MYNYKCNFAALHTKCINKTLIVCPSHIDIRLVPTAPSQVSEVIKERVQQRSIQLSWQEPEQPNGVITEYEIKYYEKDQKDRIYSTVKSRSTSATVNNLKPSTAYVFQIRAFTAAGYGTYGPRLEVTTKEEASGREGGYQSPCSLLIGSIMPCRFQRLMC